MGWTYTRVKLNCHRYRLVTLKLVLQVEVEYGMGCDIVTVFVTWLFMQKHRWIMHKAQLSCLCCHGESNLNQIFSKLFEKFPEKYPIKVRKLKQNVGSSPFQLQPLPIVFVLHVDFGTKFSPKYTIQKLFKNVENYFEA